MVAKGPLYPLINPISGSSPSLDGFEIGELYKGNQDFVTRFASVEVGEEVTIKGTPVPIATCAKESTALMFARTQINCCG